MLVDARVYTLFRRAYSVVLTLSWIQIWPHRYEFLAETGVIGLGPSELIVDLIMVGALASIVCLGLGKLTRLALIFSYLWLIFFFHHIDRGQTVLDVLSRCFGFILIISPTAKTGMVSSHGLKMIQWQMFVMYVSTFLSKIPNEAWQSGEMISYFMLSRFSNFSYAWMADLGLIGALLTYGTLAIELCVCPLLWCRKTRRLGFILGWGMHGTMAIISTLPVIQLMTMVGYLAFLSPRKRPI